MQIPAALAATELQRQAAALMAADRWAAALAPLIALSRMGAAAPDAARLARQHVGWCLFGLGDCSGALARFRSCLPEAVGLRRAHVLLGICRAGCASGDPEAARLAVVELRALDPAIHPEIGMIRDLAGAALAEAEGRWDDVLRLVEGRPRPDRPDPRYEALALRLESRARSETGDLPNARRVAERLSELPLGAEGRADALAWAATLARADGDLAASVRLQVEALRRLRADGELGPTIALAIERAEDRIQLRDVEIAAANDALYRATDSLDRLRHQLEERVAERTRELEAEVAARRHAEAIAVQNDEARSRFLATMSHELRTPLNAIIGYAEILEEDLAPPSTEAASAIRSSGRDLLAMIDQVLDLTRIEAGHVEDDP